MDCYNDMPLRAFAITYVSHDEELQEQVFQGRSMAEAVQAAEVRNLEERSIPFTKDEPAFEKAWDNHWNGTHCKPEFIVGKVRDLGIILNQEVAASPT